ncbi:hypothetical protein [Dyadobacter frigoris]|uniref:Uncharacterized protein n=1 Tax=Dyadobacter frigoris TaxID=2576211 RepID=A0A4U6CZZ6_9BACT|nr:hypothetical protein [Dyadobacter frigoris]TKT90439.1 hypothetical protein FDK13_19045 [Dyadobacter frigoris]GLU51436.1 hypothetical protein Dfri01_08970 [Dyadobacter frigoris]
MKSAQKNPSVIGFNNESYMHYLAIRYIYNSEDPKWEGFRWTGVSGISEKMWIELHHTAKHDVENEGGSLKGYEFVNDELVTHDWISSNSWPANWMWVIQSEKIAI